MKTIITIELDDQVKEPKLSELLGEISAVCSEDSEGKGWTKGGGATVMAKTVAHHSFEISTEEQYHSAIQELCFQSMPDSSATEDEVLMLEDAVAYYETSVGYVTNCCNTPHIRGPQCDKCFESEALDEAERRNR